MRLNICVVILFTLLFFIVDNLVAGIDPVAFGNLFHFVVCDAGNNCRNRFGSARTTSATPSYSWCRNTIICIIGSRFCSCGGESDIGIGI